MGWETRKGKLYYYRKQRVEAGRVRSVYMGGGQKAIDASMADGVPVPDQVLENRNDFNTSESATIPQVLSKPGSAEKSELKETGEANDLAPETESAVAQPGVADIRHIKKEAPEPSPPRRANASLKQEGRFQPLSARTRAMTLARLGRKS